MDQPKLIWETKYNWGENNALLLLRGKAHYIFFCNQLQIYI